jgi:hypothetical protein
MTLPHLVAHNDIAAAIRAVPFFQISFRNQVSRTSDETTFNVSIAKVELYVICFIARFLLGKTITFDFISSQEYLMVGASPNHDSMQN